MKITVASLFYFLIFLANNSFIEATSLTIKDALRIVKTQNLKLPKPGKDGTRHTFNKKGLVNPNLNRITLDFLKYIDNPDMTVLDIGATFGKVAIEALKGKVKSYVACDLDKRHLALLAQRVQKKYEGKTDRLKLIYGNFPKDYKNLESNSFDAILISKVVHYYNPKQATRSLKEIYRILKPGGKLFIIAITPYVNRFKIFIPQYKQRLLLKRDYPGHVKNLRYYANPEVTTPKQHDRMHDKNFIFFDKEFMYLYLSESGLFVEKVLEFPLGFKSTTWQLDGREYVGAIARKPRPRRTFPVLYD